jgi:peptide/nickel transport system permease protein
LPVSLQIMLYAIVLALLLSIPLGVLSAYRAGSRVDRSISTTMFGLLALPNFVIALILILFLARGKSIIGLDWFPATVPTNTRIGFGENTVLHLKQILLPVIALASGLTATYMRLLRTDMVATLQEDYISVAKAKGLSTTRILFGHALRPSSFTLLTVLGINIAALISGSLIIEIIFVLPGVGTYLATAIFSRDYLVIQGVVVVLALAFVLTNLAVDLVYALLDPRIRDARAIL